MINFLLMDTWIVPVILTIAVLISAVLLVILCACSKGKDNHFCSLKMQNRNPETETFFSDNLRANSEHGFFRKLSWIGNHHNRRTSNDSLKPYKNSNCLNFNERSLSENELLDSMDDSNSFEHTILQINNTDEKDDLRLNTAYESDETLSYKSNDSKFTAYSTSTLTRGWSFAETMKSALSYSDLDKV